MPEIGSREGEVTLFPELGIVDSHHHLFDKPAQRYLLDEYVADSAVGHRVTDTVYVEMMSYARLDGPDWLRPIGEVEFANGMGAMASGLAGRCRVARAIVGYADLTKGPAFELLLDRSLACAPDRFRGVRQIALSHPNSRVLAHLSQRPPNDLLKHHGVPAALKALANRKLSFDATVFHHQLHELASLADLVPNLTIVLDHLGLAVVEVPEAEARSAVFPTWKAALLDLARRPNVVCKISGLGSTFWGFNFHSSPYKPGHETLAEAWRPYVETAIEAFGAERCMFGSNYPPDGRSCTFHALWNAYKLITAHCSSEDREKLFCSTASTTYRLGESP